MVLPSSRPQSLHLFQLFMSSTPHALKPLTGLQTSSYNHAGKKQKTWAISTGKLHTHQLQQSSLDLCQLPIHLVRATMWGLARNLQAATHLHLLAWQSSLPAIQPTAGPQVGSSEVLQHSLLQPMAVAVSTRTCMSTWSLQLGSLVHVGADWQCPPAPQRSSSSSC